MRQYRLTAGEIAARNPGAGDWLISPFDVADQVVKIAAGKTSIILAQEWRDGTVGNIVINSADGWRIVVFNDGDGIDYIDNVTAPDGRYQDDWHSTDLVGWFDPCDLLHRRDSQALLERLRAWRREAPAIVAVDERERASSTSEVCDPQKA